ncbi:hypothetical protein ACE3MQ_13110 [Paenibacillus lentus]|uniref:hypothetical protein n=1 Tax=Paenibacillus lentus TaxID=1338368 RepID=UPI003668CFE6
MNAQEIQEKIDSLHYWDAWVLKLSCDHFADEVTLVYEDSDGDVTYKFNGCYRTVFEHSVGYQKEVAVKDLSRSQMPYFLHDVEIGEVELEGHNFYSCTITMPPMKLEIWCKDIVVKR